MADAFDQMVWKSCLHGLLREASTSVCGMEQYYLETSDNESEGVVCSSGGELVHDLEPRGVAKRTRSDHGPEMSTVPLEAQSLKTLSKMKQPCRILEIDSTLDMAHQTLQKGL